MTLDWRGVLAGLPGDGRVDAHVHTASSDGTDAVADVVVKAVERGLSGLAITDHDTLDGARSALSMDLPSQFVIIPGVELTAYWDLQEVHILGYGVDAESEQLNEYMGVFTGVRRERAHKIVTRLSVSGVPIEWDSLDSKYTGSAIGRPHIARELVSCGHCANVYEAFHKYLHNGSEFDEPKYRLTVASAVEMIHASGGKAVLAHPGMMHIDSIITPIVNQGIDGLETGYPFHHLMQERWLERYAAKRKLCITGGSDFHGSNRPNIKIGARSTTVEQFRKLLAR
ncbi:MAG: PHP domain-containing protein [Candidatus Brocadiia bacterium]